MSVRVSMPSIKLGLCRAFFCEVGLNNFEKMKAAERLLSLEEVKTQLACAELSGLFVWQRGRRKGRVAGTVTPHGYIFINIRVQGKMRLFPAHRLAYLYKTGSWPKGIIDHDNQVRCDNRPGNLMNSTCLKNLHNCQKRTNKSGHTGVYPSGEGWFASIMAGGERHRSPTFHDIQQAIDARAAMELEHGFSPNHGQEKQFKAKNLKDAISWGLERARDQQAALQQLISLGYDPDNVAGVNFRKNYGKFQASIRLNHKKQHIGYFKDHTEAVFSRYCYELKYKMNQGSDAEAYVKRYFAKA